MSDDAGEPVEPLVLSLQLAFALGPAERGLGARGQQFEQSDVRVVERAGVTGAAEEHAPLADGDDHLAPDERRLVVDRLLLVDAVVPAGLARLVDGPRQALARTERRRVEQFAAAFAHRCRLECPVAVGPHPDARQRQVQYLLGRLDHGRTDLLDGVGGVEFVARREQRLQPSLPLGPVGPPVPASLGVLVEPVADRSLGGRLGGPVVRRPGTHGPAGQSLVPVRGEHHDRGTVHEGLTQRHRVPFGRGVLDDEHVGVGVRRPAGGDREPSVAREPVGESAARLRGGHTVDPHRLHTRPGSASRYK